LQIRPTQTPNETELSDAEIWSVIRYLDPASRRGVGDILAFMALSWLILLFCAVYLSFRL
jgi:hypothetical protein